MSLPHINPYIPIPIWRVGPLDRRQTAGFCAELQLHVPNAQMRPVVVAQIDGGRSTLYVIDRNCLAPVQLVLLDHQAVTVPALPRTLDAPADSGWLPGLATIAWWATKPDRDARREPAPTCRDCGAPNVDPAPGLAAPNLCKPCWRARVAAGRARAREADRQWLARLEAERAAQSVAA